MLCAREGDDAILMDEEDRNEQGFADAFDGDEVTPLERAMSYLLPDASINRIQSSIATIPVPQRMSADDVVVQGPREDRMRPGNIFTPSEIAMIEFAIESRLTRKQTKGLVKLVQEPGFHPEEISSDVLAKLRRFQIEDAEFEVKSIYLHDFHDSTRHLDN